MTDYSELVKALRETAKHLDGISRFPYDDDPAKRIYSKNMADAAAAIEALETEIRESMQKCAECGDANMPKRGRWILCGQVGWPKWKCSVCHSEGRGDYIRCPWCGAVMDESNASNASNALNALDNAQDGPIVTPCRGCSDYDGYGGCKSKGGCARAKMEVQDG